MKRIISLVLSLIMLITPAVFAAPGAVMTESVGETATVIPEAAVQEAAEAQEPAEQATLATATDLTYGNPAINALTFGVAVNAGTLKLVQPSGNNQWTASALPDGGVSISFPKTWDAYTMLTGSTFVLVPGNTYALVCEFEEGQNLSDLYVTLNSTGISQYIEAENATLIEAESDSNVLGLTKPYKLFKVAEGKQLSVSWCCIGTESSSTTETPVVVNLKSAGVYYKPSTFDSVPSYVCNAEESTITVTYPNGLHEDVKAALQIPGAISSVNSVDIDETGKVVTYHVRENTTVSIPSLVNEDATKTYPEQNLFLNVATKRVLDYGLTIFSNDMSAVSVVDNADCTIVRNADGTVTFNKKKSDYWGRVDIIAIWPTGVKGGIVLGKDKVYSFVADIDESRSDIASVYPAFHGSSLKQYVDGGTLTAMDEFSKTQNFAAGKTYKTFTLKAATFAQGSCGIGLIDTTSKVTIDKMSMYYKPEAQLEAPIPTYNFDNNTVKITYPKDFMKMLLRLLD